MRFTCVDVETANSSLASICQVGVAVYEAGELVESWGVLVDPECWFADINVSVHGITAADVAGSPNFSGVADRINTAFRGQMVVSHSGFDRSSLRQAFARSGIEMAECRWLDSASVARRAWSRYSRSGYGLANLARELGIEFAHHDAQEDAKACGEVMLRAVADSGVGIEEWFDRVRLGLDGRPVASVVRRGAEGVALSGEVLVFTGALVMPRREAADLAAAAGGDVASGVTKKTTVLVVGDQDVERLQGKAKSAKHLKVEALIAAGQDVRILAESDFLRLAAIKA